MVSLPPATATVVGVVVLARFPPAVELADVALSPGSRCTASGPEPGPEVVTAR